MSFSKRQIFDPTFYRLLKLIIFTLEALFLLFFSAKDSITYMPELYGFGKTKTIELTDENIGITYSRSKNGKWFLFLFVEKSQEGKKTGYLTQIAGNRIEQYGPYNKSTEKVFYYEREDSVRWRGFMEFRGTNRKYCGAEVGYNLPPLNSCRMRSTDD